MTTLFVASRKMGLYLELFFLRFFPRISADSLSRFPVHNAQNDKMSDATND